jgi:hypothetical protein
MNHVYRPATPVGSQRIPVRKQPRQDHKIVKCPDCGAEIGERCLNPAGEPTHNFHRSRKRIAQRKRNEAEL